MNRSTDKKEHKWSPTILLSWGVRDESWARQTWLAVRDYVPKGAWGSPESLAEYQSVHVKNENSWGTPEKEELWRSAKRIVQKTQVRQNLYQTREVSWIQQALKTHHKGATPSVHFSRSVVSDSLWPNESQHTRPPYPSPTPGVYWNSCPSRHGCHPAISSSVVPFSSCPQSLPASGCFPMSQLFAWGGQNIGVSASASVLPMKTHDLSPSGWTGWSSLQSKGLSRVFSNTTVQKHQFFGIQLSSQSNCHIHTWPLEKP